MKTKENLIAKINSADPQILKKCLIEILQYVIPPYKMRENSSCDVRFYDGLQTAKHIVWEMLFDKIYES